MTITININSIRWENERTPIANNITFSVPTGNIQGVMGRSGIGKSTVFKGTLGWMPSLIQDLTVNHNNIPLQSNEIALVPQNCEDILFPWYPVSKHFELAIRTNGGSISSNDLKNFLNNLGLDSDDLNSYPTRLSGGQQKRVALGMAILRGAKLLLLDEPFSGLDLDIRSKVLDLVYRSIHGDIGLTSGPTVGAILMISHGIDDAVALCDSVSILSGRDKIESQKTYSRPDSLKGINPQKLLFRSSSLGDECRNAHIGWENQLRGILESVLAS